MSIMRRFGFVLLGTGMMVWLAAGCSKPQEEAAAPETAPAPAVETVRADLPPLVVADDASVLAEVFPRLTQGALAYARLVDLPEGVLLRADGVSVSQADLDAQLDQVPHQHRAMLKQNGFMLLEQVAAAQLLEGEARRALAEKGQNVEAMPQQMVLQTWMGEVAAGASVSDEELEIFYNENRDMMGGSSLERIAPQLKQHLLQQKQQEAVDEQVRSLGKRMTIAVAAEWAAAQDKAGRDNPVDRARDSGTPTLASFGADTCRPCQMMKPFREAVAAKYGERLNVVYVHVNKDQMLASRYGVQGIPHTIFFDRNGEEFKSQTGLMTQDQIEAVLEKMENEE